MRDKYQNSGRMKPLCLSAKGCAQITSARLLIDGPGVSAREGLATHSISTEGLTFGMARFARCTKLAIAGSPTTGAEGEFDDNIW